MGKSVNESLLDDAIKHQIDLQKYSNAVVRQMMSVLNKADAELYAALQSALSHMDPDTFTVARLRALLASVRSINASVYAQLGKAIPAELRDFTEYEADYQKMALQSVLPVEFNVAAIQVEQVFAAAMATPFQGTILEDAVEGLSSARIDRIEKSVAHGYIQGKTSSVIVGELRGTRSLGYQDGMTEIDRRSLQAIIQTALAHVAAHTRDALYTANEDVLEGEMWSATLDQKTTSECRIRDHKKYEVGTHKPIGHSIPYSAGPGRLHYNCRSCSMPLVKSFADLLGIKDFDEDQFDDSTRASMDGQVPSQTTYNEWLQRQPAARQDEVLGPVRGKLMRQGDLKADEMYTNKGEYMTLDQLRAKHAEAFRKAGV
jgi:hypothetical protein